MMVFVVARHHLVQVGQTTTIIPGTLVLRAVDLCVCLQW